MVEWEERTVKHDFLCDLLSRRTKDAINSRWGLGRGAVVLKANNL